MQQKQKKQQPQKNSRSTKSKTIEKKKIYPIKNRSKKVAPKKNGNGGSSEKTVIKKEVKDTNLRPGDDGYKGSHLGIDFSNRIYGKISPRTDIHFSGRSVTGFPNPGIVPDMCRYSIRLTKYEFIAYDVRNENYLCKSCYEVILNRARFGLCPECFNTSLNYLYVCDASVGRIYLTKLGSKIRIMGKQVKIPSDSSPDGVLTIHEFPYINVDRPNSDRDCIMMSRFNNKAVVTKLKSHGTLPLDYVIAELF